MKTTFCRVNTSDKLRLDGLLFELERKSKIGILHLPGRAGNFYANGFLDAMVQVYIDSGFGFLSVNTRGHDHIADFRIGQTEQLRRIGAAFDIFEECVLDIDAWLEFFRARGYEKIILQGHSQGGSRAVYFLNQKLQSDIVALVLASPADAAGLLKKYSKQFFENDLVKAQDMVVQGRGGELLPCKIRDFYYVSAKSFVDEFGHGSKANIFPIFENGDFAKLENIKVPVLAFYGGKEDICINSPKQDLETIARHLKNPKSKTFIIDDADHTYLGFENKVSRSIVDWINKLYGEGDNLSKIK
jgi:pimeloyl-ACP methyl ester carboxylesterase